MNNREILQQAERALMLYRAGHDIELTLKHIIDLAKNRLRDRIVFTQGNPEIVIDGKTRAMLTPRELNAFAYLYSYRGEPVTAEALMRFAFGFPSYDPSSDRQFAVGVVSLIRRKLGCSPDKPRFIHTQWGHAAWILYPEGIPDDEQR